MASIDSLPADHRAVLQLVLQRGRSYDDIAALLSIDRAAVRERALSALDALGPGTGVPPERRALITDYLLGQLPPRVSEDVRDRLAESAGERAWARVVASELAPLAGRPLPEIPAEGAGRDAAAAPVPAVPESKSESAPAVAPTPVGSTLGGPQDPRPSSRVGGAILLGAGALIVVIVVLIVVLASSGDSSSSSSTAASATTSTPSATSSATSTTSSTPTTSAASSSSTPTATTATTSTTGSAKPIAQVNLTSPTGSKGTAGVAVVVKQGNATGLVIRATGVPANTTHDAYAVWLYNSPTDSRILGFVNPGVKANGVLQTAGGLPTNAAHFKQLLVTLESQAKPATPGKIVLQGALSL